MMEEKITHPLLVNPAVYQELVRRAARRIEKHESNHWAEYFLLLETCRQILAAAPASVEACEDLDIEGRLVEDFDRLVQLICRVFPGGMDEFHSYTSSIMKKLS